MSRTTRTKIYCVLDPEECIPMKHLSDALDAAPPIADKVFFPPLLVWGVPVDLPWIRCFAKEHNCESQVPPETSDIGILDPNDILLLCCNARMPKGVSLETVFGLGEEGKVVSKYVLCVYHNYMPKEERRMPPDFQWPDDSEGAEPMWYYHTMRRIWRKRVYY